MTEVALALGIAGWVRNRRDGSVEVCVQGDEQAVERLVAWGRRGPPGAHVTEVVAEPLVVDPARETFAQLPTE